MRRFPALIPLLVLAACAGNPRPPARLPDRRPPPVAPHHPVAKPAAKAVPKPAAARPTPRPVQPQAQASTQARVHVVQAGDTGIGIARAYGIRWSELVALNGLVPPFAIRVGDRLKLPSQAVVASRSLEERARAFDLDIDDIVTGGEPAVPAPRRPVPGASAPAMVANAPAPLPALPANAPRFQWPVEGRVLTGFGPKPGGRFNDGVNLKASAGQAVRAAGDGVVAYAGDAIPAFGNLVLIKHGGGWVSAYAHNEALLVQRGQRVRGGDVIARAGQTGDVKEPQLHFELRRGRAPVDPVKTLGGR